MSDLMKVEKEAVRGSVKAQFALANMHHKGEGVPKNLQKAYNWYRMAAERGHAPSRRATSLMLLRGVTTVYPYI